MLKTFQFRVDTSKLKLSLFVIPESRRVQALSWLTSHLSGIHVFFSRSRTPSFTMRQATVRLGSGMTMFFRCVSPTFQFLVCWLLVTNAYAMDLPGSSMPEKGIENVASQDLNESNAWWAENFDEENEAKAEPDPLEPLNRTFFNFNRVLDGILLKPLAIIYNNTVADPVKTGVDNFIDNAFAPISVFNSALQGEGQRAIETLGRFAVNTVFGLFGLIDVTKEMSKEKHYATFNQTLATWGAPTGPYLMIPCVGPSSFRGAAGLLADWAMNPLYWILHNKHRMHNKHRQQMYLWYALYGVDIVNRRSKLIEALNDIEKNSLDPYATIRSIYFQKQAEMEREIETRRGKAEA